MKREAEAGHCPGLPESSFLGHVGPVLDLEPRGGKWEESAPGEHQQAQGAERHWSVCEATRCVGPASILHHSHPFQLYH